jgi:hypothetical protein
MNRLLTIAGTVLFVSAIAAHWLFGASATIRVVALGLVLAGVNALLVREVPVGWEGRPPSFRLRGHGAVLLGVAAIITGIGALVFASRTACAIGWSVDCSSSAT